MKIVCRVCGSDPKITNEENALVATCPKCATKMGSCWGQNHYFLAQCMLSEASQPNRMPAGKPVDGLLPARRLEYSFLGLGTTHEIAILDCSVLLVKTSHPHPYKTKEGWDCIINESSYLPDCVLVDAVTGKESVDLCEGLAKFKKPGCYIFLTKDTLYIRCTAWKWVDILTQRLKGIPTIKFLA